MVVKFVTTRSLGLPRGPKLAIRFLQYRAKSTQAVPSKDHFRRIAPPPPPPHFLLPNKMLLRALLVATVSSHSWLLKPALRVLSLLAHPRVSLLDVNKNPLLRQILKMTFYNHFCAGESGAGVQSTIRKIKDMGFRGG